MAVAKQPIETDAQWLSPAEAYEVFDEQARTLAGMSGEEFLLRWRAGDFDAIADEPDHRHLMYVAMFLPGGQHNAG